MNKKSTPTKKKSKKPIKKTNKTKNKPQEKRMTSGFSDPPKFPENARVVEVGNGMYRFGERKIHGLEEKWENINHLPGFENIYKVSTFAEVRRIDTDALLKPNKTGQVELYPLARDRKKNPGKFVRVTRLVARYFLGKPTKKKPIVIVIDGDPFDPNNWRADNLRYANESESRLHYNNKRRTRS